MTQILLLTNDGIGTALLETARNTLGNLPKNVENIPITHHCQVQTVSEQVFEFIKNYKRNHHDLLILTDLFGSTPCNLARKFSTLSQNIAIVSGLNLPMLLRTLTYQHLPLQALQEKALSGGHDGILSCNTQAATHD